MARFVWNTIFNTFDIQPPKGTYQLFGSWIRIFAPGPRKLILVGVAAICWVLWLNKNDVVFQNLMANSYLQVIFRGTFWIRQWSLLSKEEEGKMMKQGCSLLEGVALQLFGSCGWKNQKWIEA